MAKEVREMAYRELNEDVNDVKNRLENLAQEVSNIGEDISRATGVLRFLLGLLKK
jgi:tetrahydromethanopterin S-methyltransferase subunit G